MVVDALLQDYENLIEKLRNKKQQQYQQDHETVLADCEIDAAVRAIENYVYSIDPVDNSMTKYLSDGPDLGVQTLQNKVTLEPAPINTGIFSFLFAIYIFLGN